MSSVTLAELAPMIRAEYQLPDKSYRKYALGQEVGRFLRAKRVEGAAQATLLSYEHTLRLFTLDHADLALEDFARRPDATDLLYDFLAKWWEDSAPGTVHARATALRSFFNWAEDRIGTNPARRLKSPRRRGRANRHAHGLAQIQFIAAAQETVADEAFILLMGRLALRKMEAASLRARDIDLRRDLVYLSHTKGGETAEVPIVYRDVRVALDLWLREGRHPDERLLAPRSHPRRRPHASTIHRRFKRCLELAGVEDFPMHELRHSAGDHLHRITGDVKAAQQLFRHASLQTTQDYLHPTREDLRARMRQAED